jgi:hypothetical protein
MKAHILWLAIPLILILTSCGSATSGPSTQVEAFGIQTTLPGTDWHKLDTRSVDSLQIEQWETGDKSMFFRIATNPDEDSGAMSVDRASAKDYMSIMGYPPSSVVNSRMIAGRSAVRMEGVSPGDTSYHNVDYEFIAALRHYYIGGGATNAKWANGGSDAVENMVDSMKVVLGK